MSFPALKAFIRPTSCLISKALKAYLVKTQAVRYERDFPWRSSEPLHWSTSKQRFEGRVYNTWLRTLLHRQSSDRCFIQEDNLSSVSSRICDFRHLDSLPRISCSVRGADRCSTTLSPPGSNGIGGGNTRFFFLI